MTIEAKKRARELRESHVSHLLVRRRKNGGELTSNPRFNTLSRLPRCDAQTQSEVCPDELAGPTAAGLSLYYHIIRSGIVGKIPLVKTKE